jgi:uncharacterized protein (DUF1015 family)
MARIEPFKGIRPSRELVEKVASPPYDVLSSAEAREITDKNRFSFLRIVKPEVDLPAGVDLYSDEVYAQAKRNLAEFLKGGILFQDDRKYFYIYRQTWQGHTQTGLVAGASARDYLEDTIKKHELTREAKEKDRIRHIETLNANTGPVFLTYKHQQSLDSLFRQATEGDPEYEFTTLDGVEHLLYVVKDEDLIARLKEAFYRIPVLYVADGHHRSAAGTAVMQKRRNANPRHTGDEEYNFFLSVIFPHNQMKILPYNRAVKDLRGMCRAEFMKKLEERFQYEETAEKRPRKMGEFCMNLDGKWYLLRPRKGTSDPDDPVESLDVAILQNNLLSPVLGIDNPRTDDRIHFVGGIRGTGELERLVDKEGYRVAFSLYPTSIEQLFRVADTGRVMPPKSTWFEPKLRSGLVIHNLNEG